MEAAPVERRSSSKMIFFIKLLVLVVFLGAIILLTNYLFGNNYTMYVSFFMILYTYFGWAAYRRRENSYEENKKNSYQSVIQSDKPTVEQQIEQWQFMENRYTHCKHCNSELIPGLSYCEECGSNQNS